MTRAYRVKGKKRKNKDVVEKYHREEEDEEQVQSKKPNLQNQEPTLTQTPIITEENSNNELVGIPIVPPTENNTENPGVIFILERASLEVAKVGKTYQLLNSDEHAHFLRTHNKNPNDYRPDICHQALLSILDSPLNKAGRWKMVYVRTEKGVLIEVKSHVRLPRTFKRFAGLMLELLQKLSVSPAGKREKLLRTLKNPVTQYLPTNSRKAGLSFSSEKLVNMKDYLSTIPSNMDLVFVVGAMAHGKIETDYTDDYIAVSGYPLSAAYCIARICNSIEGKWNILFIFSFREAGKYERLFVNNSKQYEPCLCGAMAHGKIETDYTEDYIAVSGCPLSAALCIGRICNSIEEKWNIL